MLDLRLHLPCLAVYPLSHLLHLPGRSHCLQCSPQFAVERQGGHGVEKCNKHIQWQLKTLYIFPNFLSCHSVKMILSNCISQSLQVVSISYKNNNRFNPFNPVLWDQFSDLLIEIILIIFISHKCRNRYVSNCCCVGTFISLLELDWRIVL